MTQNKLTDQQLQEIIDDNYCDFDLQEIKATLQEMGNQDLDDYIRAKVREEIQDMTTNDLIALFNEYCSENSYWDDEFRPLWEYEINSVLSNKSPYDILQNYNEDFDINADYFKSNYNAELTSYTEDEARDEIIEYYLDNLIDYVIENELACEELLNSKDALIEILEEDK